MIGVKPPKAFREIFLGRTTLLKRRRDLAAFIMGFIVSLKREWVYKS